MQRTLAALALGCAFAATAARAIRLPNDFAEAHWLLDYRYGLIKRGLAGSVLGIGLRFGVRPSETLIAWIAAALLAALSIVLVALTVRILARLDRSIDAYLVLAVFATSPFVVTAAHLAGYLDHPNFLLTLAAVWLALQRRAAAAGAVAAAATLVHEAFAVLGLPAVLAASLARPGRRSRFFWILAPPLVAFAAIAFSESQVLDRPELRSHLVHRLSRFPFVAKDMNLLVPEWLTTPLAQNLREEAHRFADRVGEPLLLRLALPSIVVLWVLGSGFGVRGSGLGVPRWWPTIAASAIAAPLALHAIAWDTARIWTYPIFTGFACLWIAAETIPARSRHPSAVLSVLAGGVVLLNLSAGYPLLDGEVDRFTALERLGLYAPFLAGSAAFLMMRIRAQQAPAEAEDTRKADN